MTFTLRRAVVFIALLAALLPLGGCWVYSVYPLAASDDTLVFDKLLAGNWWNPQNRCSISFSRFADEKAYRIQYTTGTDASEACWMNKGSSASFVGTVVELGGARFLDVMPADMPLQNHMVLTHSFYRLKVDVNSLTLTPMAYDAVESAIQQEKLPGVRRDDNLFVLTATTKDLREFVRQNAASEAVWNPSQKLDFQRRFDGQ